MREMVKGGRAGSGAVKGVGSLLSGSFGAPSGLQRRLEPEAHGDRSLPVLRMDDRDPPEDSRQLPVGPRPEEQMPVGGREAYAAIRTHVCAWAACRMCSKAA